MANLIEQKKQEVRQLKKQLEVMKERKKQLEQQIYDKLILLPNLPHESITR